MRAPKKRARKKKAKKALTPKELAEKNIALAVDIAEQHWERDRWKFEKLKMKLNDVCQEAFVALQRATPGYDCSRGKFSTYAGRIMDNHLNNLADKATAQKRSGKTVSLTGEGLKERDFLLEDKKQPPIKAAVRKQILKIVKSLPDVSEKHKAIFIKRYGLDGKEPKGPKELTETFGMTTRQIRYVIEKVAVKLRFHPKMQQFKGLVVKD